MAANTEASPHRRMAWRTHRFGGRKSESHLYVPPVDGYAVSVCGAMNVRVANLMPAGEQNRPCKTCERWVKENRG